LENNERRKMFDDAMGKKVTTEQAKSAKRAFYSEKDSKYDVKNIMPLAFVLLLSSGCVTHLYCNNSIERFTGTIFQKFQVSRFLCRQASLYNTLMLNESY
jgi:hypothetical protein